MTKRKQPDPGDGWRLLVEGEQILRSDEFRNIHGCWVESNSPGEFLSSDHYPYRRRIPIEAPPATHHGGDHYQGLAIQPWDYATANRMEYNEGVVVAYVTRWRSKGGVQDLQKAIDHINKLIEFETKEATK